MTNHIHRVATGREKNSLSKAPGLAHRRCSSMINAQRGWTGHLWANRFFSTPLDDEHLWAAVRYVELSHVRGGMVDDAPAWQWSSARAHCGSISCALLSASRPFAGKEAEWSEYLASGPDPVLAQLLRANT